MRVYTKVILDMRTSAVLDSEWFEYAGPVMLCDRGQSKAVSQQGQAQSAQDQANAQTNMAATNSDLAKYNQNLNSFMQFGRKTFGADGEYMRDANTLANTTAAAGQTALKGNLATNAMKTGENTSGYAGTVAESKQESERNLTQQLAGADQSRLQALTNIEQTGVTDSLEPAKVHAAMYSTGTGGAASNLGPAASAAAQPSGWDMFGNAIIGGAGTALGGWAQGGFKH